jgi:hypothetical protein
VVKLPVRELCHSVPSSVEVKDERKFISTTPHFMAPLKLITETLFNVMVLFIIQNILEKSFAKEICKQAEADSGLLVALHPSDW